MRVTSFEIFLTYCAAGCFAMVRKSNVCIVFTILSIWHLKVGFAVSGVARKISRGGGQTFQRGGGKNLEI